MIACEPVFPRDAGSLLLDAGGTRTREGASVKRTRSVRSEPARAPTGGRSRCVFAQQMRGRPTAPTIWSFRARVPKGCGLVSFTRRWGSKLRWNSSCFGSLPAHLGTIPPHLGWCSHIFQWKNVSVSHIFRWKNVVVSHIFRWKRPNGLILAERVGRQYAATAYE